MSEAKATSDPTPPGGITAQIVIRLVLFFGLAGLPLGRAKGKEDA